MQEIPKLGFGTFRLSGRKGKSAVKSAIYAGYKHIDTAHMYKNESLVGEAIAECISEGVITREEIFIFGSFRLLILIEILIESKSTKIEQRSFIQIFMIQIL